MTFLPNKFQFIYNMIQSMKGLMYAMKARILQTECHDPWRNLAVEACLFEALGEDEAVLYLWQNSATVVVGRHQNAWQECRVQLLEAEGGKLARRSTGGGAVFHDLGNLNFSFVVPRGCYDVSRQLDVVRRAVAEYGIEARFTGRNDLTVDGAKFSGNAYKFSDKVGLHHGTLLVNVDMEKLSRYLAPGKDKLKARGIESVRSRVRNLAEINPSVDIEGLAQAMRRAFEAEYGAAGIIDGNDLEGPRLSQLEAMYSSWDFRLGKALPFDARLTSRFDWGGVTLELSLKQGRVTSAKVWSDAMDDAMIDAIAPALMGTRYENSALAEAVRTLKGPQTREIADWLSTVELG